MQNQEKPKWYDNKLVIFLLLIIFFPVGLYGLWKNKDINGAVKMVITVPILVFIFVNMFTGKSETKKQSSIKTSINTKTEDNEDSLTNKQLLLGYLVDTGTAHYRISILDSLSKEITYDNLTYQVAFFKSTSSYVTNGLESKDKEEVILANKVKNKIIAKQIYKFPKIRRCVYEHTKDICWENNIDVSIAGNNDVLILTGSTFANNQNIKTIQSSLYETLVMCRFKQIKYFWSKYDSEYTYFTIDSKNDRDLE